MPRTTVIAAASLLLTACAGDRQRPPATYADYRCEASSTVENGKVSVVRWLGPDGTLSSTVVLWLPVPQGSAGLTITGHWEAHPPERVDFNRGLVMFDQRFVPVPANPARFHLELRAQPGPSWQGYARLEGKTRLQDGLRLSADWADTAAMARGSEALFLIRKDRKGNVSSRTVIPRSAFEGFLPEAANLLESTARMASEFKARCQSTATDDIII